jgi:hypothetical protein
LDIYNMNKIQEPKIRFISKKNHFEIFKWICPYIFVANGLACALFFFVLLFLKLIVYIESASCELFKSLLGHTSKI